jgi:alanine-glyoxylate transaminase/serine-glyoxylate transaminase/serine-pyruvate transaminase
MIVALAEALAMLLDEEGMPAVLARHRRLAEAARACVEAWGLEQQCAVPTERSDALTAVRLPDGFDADAVRATIRERFDVALGNGLGRLQGRVFRIGHLGDFNETMLTGTLSAVEMGLRLHQVPLAASGLPAALDRLAATAG